MLRITEHWNTRVNTPSSVSHLGDTLPTPEATLLADSAVCWTSNDKYLGEFLDNSEDVYPGVVPTNDTT